MSLTGGAVGVFAAHTGLAGSVVALPLLYSARSGMAARMVTGTVLAATTFSAAGGAAAFALAGKTDPFAVASLGGIGMLTAGLGSMLSAKAPPSLVKRCVAVALLVIAPLIAFSEREPENESDGQTSPLSGEVASNSIAEQLMSVPTSFWITGAVAGFSQGFLAIGGGIVMTSLMTLTTSMTQHEIIASALASSALINTSATIVHFRMGTVNVPAALCIAVSASIAAAIASKLALQLDESVLRKCLGGALVVSSISMLR